MRALLGLVLAGCTTAAVIPDGGSGGGSGGGAGGGSSTGGGAGGGAAFAPNPRLTALADETAMNLGTFTCTENGDNSCRQVTDYGGLTYDSRLNRLLMFGGGHATTMSDSVFAFDLNDTLTWSELYAPTPCSMMTLANLDDALGAWLSGTSGPYPRPLSAHGSSRAGHNRRRRYAAPASRRD